MLRDMEGSAGRQKTSHVPVEEVEQVVIRFAGDSGDGMQLTGSRFTHTSAVIGNDVSTLPDYPAEIRAPAGSLPGVSSFQINFGSADVQTPGDQPDVLVAMNPAALKVHLPDLSKNARILVNTDAFTPQNLKKAGYESSPLEDGTLADFQVFKIPIAALNAQALKGSSLPKKQQDRCKNFWALGLLYWLYDRPLEPTLDWIREHFARKSEIAEANASALKAGFVYGEVGEVFTTHYKVRKASIEPGIYRKVSGNEALVLGCVAASLIAKTPLLYASYPITPATDVLHGLARYKHAGVRTVQSEDEIAAMGIALGAAFAGNLAVTGTSGPGLALKSEMLGLAVMAELPVVVVDVQRAGPSTGLPTKTEQSDLLQGMFGRSGDSPVVVLAPATPSDCFAVMIEAFRIAVKYMVPVLVLSDGYLGNGAEPWKLPRLEDLPKIDVRHPKDPKRFMPYLRDPATLARPWAIPGMPGFEHRIGGIEKADKSGSVNYDPANHQLMTEHRLRKVEGIANDIPEAAVEGPADGDLLLLAWGSTYGAVSQAVKRARAAGRSVSHAHLRCLNPFPRNLGDVLRRFRKVLVPENNSGQLRLLVRSRYLVDASGVNKISGQPFKIREVLEKIEDSLRG
ncbi:MAG: 2-oxoacid:acceptor oxidoreductase subunit alpha [Candidatus Eisenbacteria bacterium]